MSLVLVFVHNWHESFRVLRYHNGLGILDSVRTAFGWPTSRPEGAAVIEARSAKAK
jgi:hypothetical protein